MLQLKTLIQQHHVSQRAIARAVGVSDATLSQIVNHNCWPKRNVQTLRLDIAHFLKSRGIESQSCFKEVTRQQPKEENMLLNKQVLLPQTKKHFNVFRHPFDELSVQSADDVFMTPTNRYVRETMYQTARFGGFLAVTGESGSGKTTLRRDLIARIQHEGTPIEAIEPYVLAMEDNDIKGKTLKAASIAESIIKTLNPLETMKSSPEARFRQLHQILKDSARSGRQHVLIIEEAHSLPIPTLKHLKRFFELEDGFKKLLGIILIGQPELELKLSPRNQEVREVVQRCEVVKLTPMDAELEDFLTFKLHKAGLDIHKVINAKGIEALRHKLRVQGKETLSLTFPLAIGNLMTAAMNLAAMNELPIIDEHIIRSVN